MSTADTSARTSPRRSGRQRDSAPTATIMRPISTSANRSTRPSPGEPATWETSSWKGIDQSSATAATIMIAASSRRTRVERLTAGGSSRIPTIASACEPM